MKRTLVTIAGCQRRSPPSSSSAPVAAAAAPAAGCGKGNTCHNGARRSTPSNWSIYASAPDPDPEIAGSIAGLDTAGNGDGYLCIQEYKPSTGRDNSWRRHGLRGGRHQRQQRAANCPDLR